MIACMKGKQTLEGLDPFKGTLAIVAAFQVASAVFWLLGTWNRIWKSLL